MTTYLALCSNSITLFRLNIPFNENKNFIPYCVFLEKANRFFYLLLSHIVHDPHTLNEMTLIEWQMNLNHLSMEMNPIAMFLYCIKTNYTFQALTQSIPFE